jgi:uncharacterized protein (DUF433 family)
VCPVTLRTFRRIFGYNDSVLHRKPVLKPGQDLRDLPTYTIPEAATFLGIPHRTLQDWVAGRDPILRPSGRIGNIALLSFLDLAEAYTLEVLRNYYGFPLRDVKEFVQNARKEIKKPRPLIEADLWVVLNKLVIKMPARGRRHAQAVDLGHGRNLVIPALLEMIGERVRKDKRNSPYQIYPWRLATPQDKSQPVLMDPEVLSGRLVVTGTRIPVRVLLGMKLSAKMSDEEIAKEYRLTKETVQKALLHIERPTQKVA